MLTPREKFPLLENSSEQDRTYDTASSRTASQTHHQRAILAHPVARWMLSVGRLTSQQHASVSQGQIC